jgi:DNA-3-methyladenine glycosylase II
MQKALAHFQSADPRLAALIERVGASRIRYRPATFDALVMAIVNQQLSSKAAATIYGRLVAALEPEGVEPDGILRLTEEQLRAIGLSKQKCAYVLDLAAKTHAREVVFEELPHLSDEDVLAKLTAIKGIGVWTVHMFLLFALRRPDVLPSGDLGIQNAVQRLYELPERPKPRQVEELGAKWRPYASYAAWYLWRSLE